MKIRFYFYGDNELILSLFLKCKILYTSQLYVEDFNLNSVPASSSPVVARTEPCIFYLFYTGYSKLKHILKFIQTQNP